MPYAIYANGFRPVSEDTKQEDLAEGETLYAELPKWHTDKLAEDEKLAMISLQYADFAKQGVGEVTALNGRLATLEYLINGQDPEDPDYIEPTEDEIAEVSKRVAQLKAWNTYNVKLGRITKLASWPKNPAWPVMPDMYTRELMGIDLANVG